MTAINAESIQQKMIVPAEIKQWNLLFENLTEILKIFNLYYPNFEDVPPCSASLPVVNQTMEILKQQIQQTLPPSSSEESVSDITLNFDTSIEMNRDPSERRLSIVPPATVISDAYIPSLFIPPLPFTPRRLERAGSIMSPRVTRLIEEELKDFFAPPLTAKAQPTPTGRKRTSSRSEKLKAGFRKVSTSFRTLPKIKKPKSPQTTPRTLCRVVAIKKFVGDPSSNELSFDVGNEIAVYEIDVINTRMKGSIKPLNSESSSSSSNEEIKTDESEADPNHSPFKQFRRKRGNTTTPFPMQSVFVPPPQIGWFPMSYVVESKTDFTSDTTTTTSTTQTTSNNNNISPKNHNSVGPNFKLNLSPVASPSTEYNESQLKSVRFSPKAEVLDPKDVECRDGTIKKATLNAVLEIQFKIQSLSEKIMDFESDQFDVLLVYAKLISQILAQDLTNAIEEFEIPEIPITDERENEIASYSSDMFLKLKFATVITLQNFDEYCVKFIDVLTNFDDDVPTTRLIQCAKAIHSVSACITDMN